jgi:EpsI family protein
VLNTKRTDLHRWWLPLAAMAALFGVLLFLFPFNSGDSSLNAPLGLALWAIWTGTGLDTDQDHSYCLLVPLMVGYVLWEKRAELARSVRTGSNAGLVAVVLGLFVFWLGARAGKQYMGFIAIQVLLYGLITWFWGGTMFRKLLFTWAILIFAWPLPIIDTAVAFPLRMIVSTAAHHVLNVIGIANLQSGTALVSAPTAALAPGAKFQIDVADPCSGLHSLLPFLMFSSFYCYFFLPRTWQKWIVFPSTFIFAITGNIFRIVMLVLGCLLWGTDFALGTNDVPSHYHEGCGFAVFVVGLGLECLFGSLLIHYGGGKQEEAPASSTQPENPAPVIPAWRDGTVFAFAAVMFVLFLITAPIILPKDPGVVMELPDEVKLPNLDGGHFYGSPAQVTDAEHRMLPKDTEYARKNYDDFHRHQIYFSIVLSGLQQYTIHPPEVCLVAQGWTIVSHEDIPVQLDSGHPLMVRNLSLERTETDRAGEVHKRKSYYMYWYVADGITTASHLERNLRSSWDRIVHGRDHRWAYVIAQSYIGDSVYPDGMNAGQTREMLTAFIRQIVPTFEKSEIPSYTANR